MKIKINIDSKEFYKKPEDGGTTKGISYRVCLDKNYKELEFDEFVDAVSRKGRAFLPAQVKNETRTKECWVSQNCFCLDIEHGETLEEALDICSKYKLAPSLIYPTFSHTEEAHRFRVVFFLEETITDVRLQSFIQNGLMRFFKGKDNTNKDRVHIFNGSNFGPYYVNENARLKVPNLIMALHSYFKKDKNSSKNTLTFAKEVGINVVNGYLDCRLVNDTDYIETSDNIYLSNNGGIEYAVNFARTYSTADQEKCEIEKYKSKQELIRNFNFDELESKCQLFKNAMSGDKWLTHSEMFGVMTNLLKVVGGTTKIKELLEVKIKDTNQQEYLYKMDAWNNMANQIQKVNYSCMNCCNYCPYYADCTCETNMVDHVLIKKNKATRTTSNIRIRKIEDVREDLKAIMEYAILRDTDEARSDAAPQIYCIKAPTGIGKTETFINAIKNEKFNETLVYAAPTHKLLRDVAKRLSESGFVEDRDYMVYPELPEFEERSFIEKLYAAGAHQRAMSELKKIAKTNEVVKDYLDKKNRVEGFNKIILITHNRLIYCPLKSIPHKYVIDEDIFQSTMFPINIVKVTDLINSTKYIEENFSDYKDLEAVKSFTEEVIKSNNSLIYSTPKTALVNKDQLAKHLVEKIKVNEIDSNVLDFFDSIYYIRQDNNIIYIKKNNFQFHMNTDVLILSATINEHFVKYACEGAKFFDLGQVEYKGKLYQLPGRSMSRTCIRKDMKGYERYVEKLTEKYIGEDYNLITFQEFMNNKKSDFEKELNLWNCVGLDSVQDKDLVIVGTPHCPPAVYHLLASALGISTNGSKSEYRQIERNGYQFYFNTYSGNFLLSEIQMYVIESVLMQATGRARLVNNSDRTVLLFSNLILPQATVFNYSSKEIKELMK